MTRQTSLIHAEREQQTTKAVPNKIPNDCNMATQAVPNKIANDCDMATELVPNEIEHEYPIVYRMASPETVEITTKR
jgi:hypothetical protein